MTHLKLTRVLYDEMLRDLRRRHPFAAERNGFAMGRLGTGCNDSRIIILTTYHPIPDDQYVKDRTVGARIGPEAITWGMQAVYAGRARCEGIFHVHLHGHRGETGMSETDEAELPRLIPGFRSVGRAAAHGFVILSLDHGTGWIWLPGQGEPERIKSIAVIGPPIAVFLGEGT